MATYSTKLPNGSAYSLQDSQIRAFASDIGIDQVAPGRYSILFAFKLLMFSTFQGLDIDLIIEEIKALEGLPNRAPATKPASKFTAAPLKGLWHKHFFGAQFLAQNIQNHLANGRMETLVNRIFDPAKSATVTKEMINELAKAVTHDSLIEREQLGKLTGEWLVFAKHNGQNYYLTIAVHPTGRATGDAALYAEINSMPFNDFPFLRPTSA